MTIYRRAVRQKCEKTIKRREKASNELIRTKNELRQKDSKVDNQTIKMEI